MSKKSAAAASIVPSRYKVGDLLFSYKDHVFYKIVKVNPKSVSALAYDSESLGDRVEESDGTIRYNVKCGTKHPIDPMNKCLPMDKPLVIRWNTEWGSFAYKREKLYHSNAIVERSYNPRHWP